MPDGQRATAVACALIAPDLSLTVARFADGWGFQNWYTAMEAPIAQSPAPDDVARRFDSETAVIEHFRVTYGRTR